MKNKVYIIDYELISPITLGKDSLHENLRKNQTGENLVTRFDTRGMPFKVGAEVQEDLKHLYKNEDERIRAACYYDRKFELLVACYHLAEKRFKPLIEELRPSRGGVVLGVGSDVTKMEEFEADFIEISKTSNAPYKELIATQNTQKGRLNKIWNPYDIHAIYLAGKLHLAAFQNSILTACTSSTQAIAFGFDAIKNDAADLVVCGGTDSIINNIALASFGKLGVITESDGTNTPTCIPFDTNRKGTLAAEAAGLVVLVSEDYAKKQNLTPIAELVSYGNTLDGYKITAPDPSGKAMQRAIRTAIVKGDISPKEIDYIQAHGTGTRHNDQIEADAIKAVFAEAAKDVLISSTKDRHGHAIAAAGVQEFNILLNCLEHDFIPGMVNLRHPLDEDLNFVRQNKTQSIQYALTNNFAFGGVNTSILVKNIQ